MDIEDIERHKHNFRLFRAFIKKEGIYCDMKKLMFINYNRTPNDLFKAINSAPIHRIITYLDYHYNLIDRKWSAVFSYTPFCKFSWGVNNKFTYTYMKNLVRRWAVYLGENNFDKIKQ